MLISGGGAGGEAGAAGGEGTSLAGSDCVGRGELLLLAVGIRGATEKTSLNADRELDDLEKSQPRRAETCGVEDEMLCVFIGRHILFIQSKKCLRLQIDEFESQYGVLLI